MINKIIWKLLLIGGGLAGGFYSIPKLLDSYSNLQSARNDTYSAFLGVYIGEYEGDITKFGILSAVCIIALIIGCLIPTQDNNNNNNNNNNDNDNNNISSDSNNMNQ